jgi:hypothetical protein
MTSTYTGQSTEDSVVSVAGPGCLHKARVATDLQADEAAALLHVISNTKSVAQLLLQQIERHLEYYAFDGSSTCEHNALILFSDCIGRIGVRDLAAYHSSVSEDRSEESCVEEGEGSVCTLEEEGDGDLVTVRKWRWKTDLLIRCLLQKLSRTHM